MLKILFDCHHRHLGETGILSYSSNLSAALSDLLQQKQLGAITCLIDKEDKNKFSLPRQQLVLRSAFSKVLSNAAWKSNIYHISNSFDARVPLLPPSVKVVLTIHHWPFLSDEKTNKASLAALKKLVDRSDAIVCLSEQLLRLVKREFKIQKKPAVVIYNGCNLLSDAPPYPVKYKPYLPFVFTIGTVEPRKMLQSLLPFLVDEGIELVIAGRINDKSYADTLRKLAWDNSVSDRIRLIGAITESDKAWYYRNCKAFAFSSADAGGGAALLEALKFGKPIFVSDDSPLTEIGGEACFYFDEKDPVQTFQTFSDGIRNFNKQQFNQRMLHRSKVFNWQDKASEYLQLYRSLI